MSKDSEIAEVGRFLTEERKKRKAVRISRWVDRDKQRLMDFLAETFGIAIFEHTEYHYSFIIDGFKYEYWPSNNRLRRAGWKQSMFKNVDALIPFLKSRHPRSPESQEV